MTAWFGNFAHATLCRESRAGMKNDGIHWTLGGFASFYLISPWILWLRVMGCGVGVVSSA